MIGAGMLCVGIYNIVLIQRFGVFARDEYITGGVIFVIVGIAKIILSIVGIIGWKTGWKYLLGVYSIMVIFLILPTLAAGIFGLQQWYFVFNEVGVAMNRTYSDGSLYDSTSEQRQEFRNEFRCCGIRNGEVDYMTYGREPPLNDCNSATEYRQNTTDVPRGIGCQYYISDAIKFHLYYIGAIGLGFGFFEIVAAIVAMQHAEGL